MKSLENESLKRMDESEPVRVAHQIIRDLIKLRDELKSTAEGFATLDFAQGVVASELPTDTARDIIMVLRGEVATPGRTYLNDLTLFWLENYRRAYSQIIMRVLEHGSGPQTA